jgi:hypothetical protein
MPLDAQRERAMTKHTGGCHCGAVRFQVEADLSQPVMECDCSHCSRKGFLLTLVPVAQFKLLSGEDALTEYRFNKEHVAHQFCRTCGVQSFAAGKMPDGTEVRSVNVRCLDDVDVGGLTITQFDGKSL